MQVIFSTTAPFKDVSDSLHKIRAFDYIYETDRTAVGLPASLSQVRDEVLLVARYGTFGKTYHYSIETNIPSWTTSLKELPEYHEFKLINTSEEPWTECVVHDLIQEKCMSLAIAKTYIPFEVRVEHRAYDLSFSVYCQKKQQKIAIVNLADIFQDFFCWLNNDKDGQLTFSTMVSLVRTKLT